MMPGGRAGAYNHASDECLFDTFLVMRSGFLQDKGSPGSGCPGIAAELAYKFGCTRTRVELESWDDNPESTAEWIYRAGTKRTKPKIAIFAYSWGCGYGFVRLALALQRRGLTVHGAVLCDPVYHGLARWRALIPRTLFRRVTVTIPGNVNDVFWMRQHCSTPAGHDLAYESEYTVRREPFVLPDTPHTEMDNHWVFRDLCLSVARQVVSGSFPLASPFPPDAFSANVQEPRS